MNAGAGKSPIALVLAGGGAHGAYEAGVLRYILETLPGETGVQPRFDIFSGTSVGALHSCFLASRADEPARSASDLTAYWKSVTMERVLGFGLRELLGIVNLLFGQRWDLEQLIVQKPRPPCTPHRPVTGLFDTAPLRQEMVQHIPWPRLQENLRTGALRGVALCATEVCTGRPVLFYQTHGDTPLDRWRHPSIRPLQVEIQAEHALASAAIPFLFPSIQIRGTCYVDGALHQNTPLAPAIRLGAERIAVISLLPPLEAQFRQARLGCRKNPHPGAFFLLGRMVNAMLLERLDHELARMEMFNHLIESGIDTYGTDFLDAINHSTSKYRRTDYRLIRTLHIRPSRGLHQIGLEALNEAPHELQLPGVLGKLLCELMTSTVFLESELLSYLMFTPTFVSKLIQLGHEDARLQRDELVAFFGR